MHTLRPFRLSDCMVFFDFDNTITSFDVLDDIIERFSVDRKWAALEKEWKEGRIGSLACLAGQLESVRITRKKLERYLSTVKVDPYLIRLLALFRNAKIKPVILSDSFAPFIRFILRNNRIRGIEVRANKIRFSGDRLMPSFPHTNKRCFRCGHCKRKHLSKEALKDKIVIYIGDGLSDVCPAGSADLVFAKDSLLEYFKDANKPCFAFRNLKDVYNYMKRVER